MTPRVYFILGFTFLVGMFSGGYLYVTSFAPDYRTDNLEELTDVPFKLQGESYGGCQRSGMCADFVLESNRSFVLDVGTGRSSDQLTTVEGKLHKEVFDELVALTERTNWENMEVTSDHSCSSYVDGADYRYLLTYAGMQISLDTCGMEFGNSEASSVFTRLWDEMENTEKEVFMKDGVDGFLRDELDKRFEYDN